MTQRCTRDDGRHMVICILSLLTIFCQVLTDGPRFLEPIPNVTVALGRDASLPCVIENLGSYKVAWIHIDRQMILTIHRYVVARVPRYSVSHDSQKTWLLHVYGVQQEDRGYYMCQVNTNPMISQVGYLQVVVPPNIVDEESTQSSVAVREHQNITLTCKAEGFPAPKITWRREDGQSIAIDKRKKVSVYDGETLNLVKISRLEMGAYLCIASNGVPPSVSKRIIVDVEFSPMIWVPNQLVGAPAGTDVTIDCHTEAYPRSISYWVFDNIMLLPTKKYATDVSENSYRAHMRLTIKNLQNKDFGNYRCISKNSLGETEGSIRLYEIPMPSLPSAAKEMKSGTSTSKLENLLVKSANPIGNEKKPGPSKMSREEVPSRAAEKEAKPPDVVHSSKSSGRNPEIIYSNPSNSFRKILHCKNREEWVWGFLFGAASEPARRPANEKNCLLTFGSSFVSGVGYYSSRPKSPLHSRSVEGKADGQRTALWLRARLQAHLFALGCFLHRHAGKVLFVAILVLSTFCVALKSATIQTRVEDLWVEEGGRLEKELRYTQKTLGEASGSTHELLIQTPKDPGASLLHPGALLTHLDVVQAATSVSVHLFDITWRLKDMCYSPNIPNFDVHYIDQIFENIIPCAIITPLDCFWEGSKLLGPDYPVNIPGIGSKVKWTNLNPLRLVEEMKIFDFTFPFKTLEDYLKRAGVSTGYQEKPCLDPKNPECPDTAPNKNGQVPDVGAELTGGCYGFAAKYMHWPEDLVVGGTKKNKTGYITKAKALQTVVQLMGERELYEYWSDTYKVHHVDWTQEKAALVLETWQNRFAEEVKKRVQEGDGTTPYNVYAFSTATLNDILKQFSRLNILKVAIGYSVMLIYVGLTLLRRDDPVRSQTGIGIAGVVLVSVTVAAGLGFCSLLGIAFNAATTQIIPFLAIGLGVDNMFHLTHTYAESDSEGNIDEQTGVVLKKTGLSVLMTSLCIMCTFFAAALIPIPALRVFSLQAAVLVLFNIGAMLLVFPAIVSLDLRRRRSKRIDLLCCFLPSPECESSWPCFRKAKHPRTCRFPKKLQTVTRALPPDRQQTVTVIAPSAGPEEKWIGLPAKHVDVAATEDEVEGDICRSCVSWTLTKLVGKYYAPFIVKPSVKALAIVLLIVVLTGSVWGLMRVSDGLDLTDIVPQNTNEHAFLSAQSNFFGFYNMYAVTRGDFEYPNNQELLHEYHQAFIKVSNIMKNDDGGLPDFWLAMFRDWLAGLQKSFDRDWAAGCITQERWCSNASDEGILAYKLLVQTGHVDNPIDKSLVRQVRLVDSKGIINPKAFYNYLSAWSWNDALAYGASQANLRPEPRQWYHTASDYELKIPKSAPLVYTQLPFYLYGLGDTQKITNLISEVRSICQKFEDRGLPNFPSGIPFLFWEQYLGLRQSFGLALVSALSAVFVVVAILLLNLWAALLVTFSLASMVLQLLGLMGILGIKLSAVPAVLLIVAVGIGVHFTVHVCLGFITAVGGKNRRIQLALEQMFAPVLHSAVTTFLAVAMLAFSEFDFIVRYFFYVLLALVAVGLLNGLVFFPVLLSLIGPAAEVVGLEHHDRISTPSPEPPASRPRPGTCRVSKVIPPRRHHCSRLHSEPSLTTITEEPGSWHSSHSIQSIVVQPELVVQTTMYNEPSSYEENVNTNSGSESSASSSSSPSSSSSSSSSVPPGSASQNRVTTKVTATAKVKVELHTPHSKYSHKTSASPPATSSKKQNYSKKRESRGSVSFESCDKTGS